MNNFNDFNLKHGAIVMLYHPCTHPEMVNRLRTLVTSCIRKHVITKYNLLSKERPLALVAWGCRLQMNYVDPKTVISFIKVCCFLLKRFLICFNLL